MSSKKSDPKDHYDQAAAGYHAQYERESVYDLEAAYPANFFRMQHLINSFVKNDLKRVIEVGVGEGTPLAHLHQAGMKVCGFDISPEMVKRAKENISGSGGDPSKIILGDIQEPSSYAQLLQDGKFDGLMAMGVTPHVRNDDFVLKNMMNMVREGGRVFIEYRNSIFSLFTFNRHTYEFIMDELLVGVSNDMREIVSKNLEKRLEMDKPTPRLTDEANSVGYDAILSKFHNPFEIQKKYGEFGFNDIKLLWYHYHPAMPFLEEKDPKTFRENAVALEFEHSEWRGYFLCSAFVVEATIP